MKGKEKETVMARTRNIKALHGLRVVALAMMIISTVTGMAQEKTFTLEDLNFGGTN